MADFKELVIDEEKLRKDIVEYFGTACVGWEILCCYTDIVQEYAAVNDDRDLMKFITGFKMSLGYFKDLKKKLKERGFDVKCMWDRAEGP